MQHVAAQLSETAKDLRLNKSNRALRLHSMASYGRGARVGRGRGVGVDRGVSVAVAVGVAVAVALLLPLLLRSVSDCGTGIAVAVGVGVGVVAPDWRTVSPAGVEIDIATA